jgi:CRP/FNR family transcriptional regulator
MRIGRETVPNGALQCSRAGEFFTSLSPEARSDFKSLESLNDCPGSTILFLEGETSSRVLILREGQIKLSINSIGGKRLILGIARPTEILGLTSALSGNPYEVTAETMYPCKISSLSRQDLLEFFLRHPVAYQSAFREVSLDYSRACEQLRTLGLAITAQAKLARLLLEWCAGGHETERDNRFTIFLTHEEIGECIGTSRETVTRTLNDFQHRLLVELRGSTLVISNRVALERYAGIHLLRDRAS